jgi:hypothetical protein
MQASERDQLRNEHYGNWDTLAMTGNEDEVRLRDGIHPIEQQLPEQLDSLFDLAFAFEGNLLHFTGVPMVFCPFLNSRCRRFREFDGGASGLS